MNQEIEATYLNIDKDSVRGKLKAVNFVLKHPEYLMRRKTFDFSRVSPGQNKWGRVRQEADRVTMTIKEIKGSGINDIYELEMIVDDFEKASQMFELCNAPTKAFQENFREVWVRDTAQVTIDTWPGLRPFVEVEAGEEQSVKDISTELGFSFDSAVFGSIDLVYEKELGIPATEIVKLPNITFDNPPKIKGAA